MSNTRFSRALMASEQGVFSKLYVCIQLGNIKISVVIMYSSRYFVNIYQSGVIIWGHK